MLITLADIRAAHDRIRDKVHRTPVLTSESLDRLFGCTLRFKAENLQKVGAFKARGATNAVYLLGESEAKRGVVTHSSGNHAAALARAARLRGIPAHIVMPSTAPKVKIESVRRYGGSVTFCEPTLAAREAAAGRILAETGAALVHPFNDGRIIAGQGTAALELLADCPDLDAVLAPVGGGGLLSGTAVAAKALRPGIRAIGVEPALADDAARSLQTGTIQPQLPPKSIADGLLTSLGDITFAHIRANVDDIATVSEEAIVAAMRLLWSVLKTVVEPSGAVPLAALLENKIDVRGKRVGIILSGGNVDLDRLPWPRVSPG